MIPCSTLEGFPPPDFTPYDYQVNLWDPDHLDRPRGQTSMDETRAPGPHPQFPLVAISPDGKTVAVAATSRQVCQAFLRRGRPPALEESEGETKADRLAGTTAEMMASLNRLRLIPRPSCLR